MRAGDGFDTALGEEAVLGRVDGLGIGRNRRDPLHAGLLAAKMPWVAVVAGTPAIRRISSCTVRVGECSAAYKEASFAGSTRHDIHQVLVDYLARIIGTSLSSRRRDYRLARDWRRDGAAGCLDLRGRTLRLAGGVREHSSGKRVAPAKCLALTETDDQNFIHDRISRRSKRV